MIPTKYNIPLEKIRSYLESGGWRIVNNNRRWCVFEGQKDVKGDPFEIVLPKKDRSPEYPIYVMHMIEILSSLAEKPQELIVQEIENVGCDVLYVRVDGTAGATSIPFHLAAKQIPNLKQLVAYAACSEKNQKAHYRDSWQGRAMAEHFRFGHTLSGSFGYRVESAVSKNVSYKEDSNQLRQLEIFEEHEVEEIPPLERRVMERIVRGLTTTAATASRGDLEPLLKGYGSGFNANMCYAILKILDGHDEPIDFSVSWSKKIPVSEDVKTYSSIRIDRTHFDYLKVAHKELKHILPQRKTIEGRVTALSSDDDPRSDNAEERSVIVRVTSGKHKRRKIRIGLGKRDYERAHRAHINWNTIAVTGVMQHIGSHWYLSDAHDLMIISMT